jgi:hypothetical protein
LAGVALPGAGLVVANEVQANWIARVKFFASANSIAICGESLAIAENQRPISSTLVNVNGG